jgi:hypothetical protein
LVSEDRSKVGPVAISRTRGLGIINFGSVSRDEEADTVEVILRGGAKGCLQLNFSKAISAVEGTTLPSRAKLLNQLEKDFWKGRRTGICARNLIGGRLKIIPRAKENFIDAGEVLSEDRKRKREQQ